MTCARSADVLSYAIAPLAEMERRTLLTVLKHHDTDQSAAASLLDVSAAHTHIARMRDAECAPGSAPDAADQPSR